MVLGQQHIRLQFGEQLLFDPIAEIEIIDQRQIDIACLDCLEDAPVIAFDQLQVDLVAFRGESSEHLRNDIGAESMEGAIWTT